MLRFFESGLTRAATAAVFASTAVASPEPGLLPEPYWWRDGASVSIARDPMMRERPGWRIDSEWAPLYSSSDGGRFEQARHSLRATTRTGPWRMGAELESRSSIARGFGAGTHVGLETPATRLNAIALARAGRRLEWGGAAFVAEGRPGASLAAAAPVGPAVRASLAWSRLPEQGEADVRWQDVVVLADGTWDDQRVAWLLEAAPRPDLAFWLGQDALDRRSVNRGPEGRDQLLPSLSWRATHAGLRARGLGVLWQAEAHYGEGRQRMEVAHVGTTYAVAAGPVVQSLATVEARFPNRAFRARAWFGRSSGDAQASLALWPFDVAVGLIGTRRIAHSELSLQHGGLGMDVASRRGLECGLALSRIAPRAGYESWQATFVGLGRDDASSGDAGMRGAWLLGARLAASLGLGAVRARAELVQWLPLAIEREARAGGGASGSPATPAAGSSSAAGTRGGTVLRFSIERPS